MAGARRDIRAERRHGDARIEFSVPKNPGIQGYRVPDAVDGAGDRCAAGGVGRDDDGRRGRSEVRSYKETSVSYSALRESHAHQFLCIFTQWLRREASSLSAAAGDSDEEGGDGAEVVGGVLPKGCHVADAGYVGLAGLFTDTHRRGLVFVAKSNCRLVLCLVYRKH